MSKRIHKVRKWETTGGKIIVTEFEEHGPDISIKDAIKRGMIEVSSEEMQKLFSETELKEMGYDNISKNRDTE